MAKKGKQQLLFIFLIYVIALLKLKQNVRSRVGATLAFIMAIIFKYRCKKHDNIPVCYVYIRIKQNLSYIIVILLYYVFRWQKDLNQLLVIFGFILEIHIDYMISLPLQ